MPSPSESEDKGLADPTSSLVVPLIKLRYAVLVLAPKEEPANPCQESCVKRVVKLSGKFNPDSVESE